jgi:hypothetical protein
MTDTNKLDVIRVCVFGQTLDIPRSSLPWRDKVALDTAVTALKEATLAAEGVASRVPGLTGIIDTLARLVRRRMRGG